MNGIIKFEKLSFYLKKKFPDASNFEISWFLNHHNSYIDNIKPKYYTGYKRLKRLENLFERFLHPADIF